MKKNDCYTVLIEDLTADGEGIGKADGFPLFIKDALPGDRCEVKVMKMKKRYGYAKLLRIISPSPDRIEPRCPRARACGGCQIQHMSYEAQIRFKTRKVEENLRRIGGFQMKLPEALHMEDPFGYRNKAQVPFGYDRAGKTVAGFYAGHTHDIIEITDCALAFPEAGEILRIVKAWMAETGVTAYREEDGSGFLRHALIRKGRTSGEIMLCLVGNGEGAESLGDLSERLKRAVSGYRTLCLNINEKPGNVILGERTVTIDGPGYIEDEIDGVRFFISPESFYQVNPVMTEILYKKALEFAGLTGNETVWDVYSGIGTISLFLARHAKKVYGVEIVPRAVRDARENAARNGFANTEFFVGKAEEVLPAWHAAHPEERIDVVVVDPPRKGLDSACIDTILQMAPARVVYVSCDSATLARDLRILSDGGYRLEQAQPVDMFPQTVHVETVVQLSKGDIDRDSSERKSIAKTDDIGMISGYNKGNKAPETTNVKIDFSLENLDLSELRGKATYEQIKDYVREQTGFRVSTLYISQVKRKCGLEVGESYNKPKSEDAKQPQCTPEKEAAIMQALRHYGMI